MGHRRSPRAPSPTVPSFTDLTFSLGSGAPFYSQLSVHESPSCSNFPRCKLVCWSTYVDVMLRATKTTGCSPYPRSPLSGFWGYETERGGARSRAPRHGWIMSPAPARHSLLLRYAPPSLQSLCTSLDSGSRNQLNHEQGLELMIFFRILIVDRLLLEFSVASNAENK